MYWKTGCTGNSHMKSLLLFSLLFKVYSTFEHENRIIFPEDFEATSVQKVILKWYEVKNSTNISFSSDAPKASSGSQSLLMTYNYGQNTGRHLYKMFPETYDSVLEANFNYNRNSKQASQLKS